MDYSPALASVMLARTPELLRVWTAGLPGPWLDAREHAGAWSVREVVCHLADLELDAWMPRVCAMLAERTDGGPNGGVAFKPLDRERFRVSFAGLPLAAVLRAFATTRERNLVALDELTLDDDALARRAVHPGLGDVTVAQLLSTWVVHDHTHIAQIARTFASQYGRAVGPWRAYLSVLS
jgi:hypothetical protein